MMTSRSSAGRKDQARVAGSGGNASAAGKRSRGAGKAGTAALSPAQKHPARTASSRRHSDASSAAMDQPTEASNDGSDSRNVPVMAHDADARAAGVAVARTRRASTRSSAGRNVLAVLADDDGLGDDMDDSDDSYDPDEEHGNTRTRTVTRDPMAVVMEDEDEDEEAERKQQRNRDAAREHRAKKRVEAEQEKKRMVDAARNAERLGNRLQQLKARASRSAKQKAASARALSRTQQEAAERDRAHLRMVVHTHGKQAARRNIVERVAQLRESVALRLPQVGQAELADLERTWTKSLERTLQRVLAEKPS